MNAKILAVVVTYNGLRWIDKCLNSLLSSTVSVDVLVIDNGSTDGTREFIECHFPSVELIKSEVNLFFGRGNNVGLKIALDQGYDYAFLLNQDAWIGEDTLRHLIDIFNRNNDYGLLSPLHYSGHGADLEHKFREYIGVEFCPDLISDKFLNNMKEVYSADFVNAAAWLLSRNCILKVGGFDPLYPHYGEDVDYVQRIKYFNLKVGICPGTHIWHDSRVQTWDEIKWDSKRMLTIYMSEVKNINGSLRSNLLIFSKRRLDELTSLLLFRNFKEFYFKVKLISKFITLINRIRKARRYSLVPAAFLTNYNLSK